MCVCSLGFIRDNNESVFIVELQYIKNTKRLVQSLSVFCSSSIFFRMSRVDIVLRVANM